MLFRSHNLGTGLLLRGVSVTDDILRYFVCMSTCGHPFPSGWFPEVSVIMTIAGLAASLNFGTPPFPLSFPGSSVGKESTCNAGDPGSIPGLERSPGEGKGYPLQYSGLENPTDRGAWWAIVQRVAKSHALGVVLCHVRLCYGCCYSRCVSQERINEIGRASCRERV